MDKEHILKRLNKDFPEEDFSHVNISRRISYLKKRGKAIEIIKVTDKGKKAKIIERKAQNETK